MMARLDRGIGRRTHLRRTFRTLLAVATLLLPLGVRGAAAQERTERDAEWVSARIGMLSLETERDAEATLRPLAAHAWDILPRVESDLGIHPTERYRMILIPPGALRDSELIRLDDAAPPWAAGFMIPERRIGAIRIADAAHYPYGTLEAVLAHEATHQLLHDAVGDRIPLWFNEGVATLQGRRWSLEDMMITTGSILTSDLPRLDSLDTFFHSSAGEAEEAYAASFGFVSWSAHRYGSNFLRDVLRGTRERDFTRAWLGASGSTLEHSERAWRRECLIRYRWFPIITASSTFWLAITLLGLLVGVQKRARARRLREKWAREEPEQWELEAEHATEGDAEVERESDAPRDP
jgi:hypothetical protein